MGPLLIAGAVASGVGSLLKLPGVIGQKNQAIEQLRSFGGYAADQRNRLKTGLAQTRSEAENLSTYQGDISRFEQAQAEAAMGKRMASGGQVAGEGILREQARQTTANTLAAAQRGAGSSTDLLTAALMGQQQEGSQMQGIDALIQNQRQSMIQNAQQQYLASMGQTASALARERGLEFSSKSAKENALLDLTKTGFQAEMNQEAQLFQQEMARKAALADTRAAIWSGVGNIGMDIGKSLMAMGGIQEQTNAFKDQLELARVQRGGAPTTYSGAGTMNNSLEGFRRASDRMSKTGIGFESTIFNQ
jgi:hypothetical protein